MDNGKVLLVYFSGTGCTKMVSDAFYKALIGKGYTVTMHSLEEREYSKCSDGYEKVLEGVNFIYILYPVYALGAPAPIYSWINDLPSGKNIPSVVISISGGGEVWPNTSCRVYCIKALERKGCSVIYEKMMVMPSNVLSPTNDHACMHLLNCIPDKVERIIDDVSHGIRRRTHFKISSRMLSFLTNIEKKNSKLYGRALKVNSNCTGCGWCVKNCPKNNISMEENSPHFGGRCIICLRCLYGCPNKAIYSKKYKFISIKEGFSLKDIQDRMQGIELLPIEKCCRGILWIGIKKYLLDKD